MPFFKKISDSVTVTCYLQEDGAINKTLLSDHASDKKINSMEITSDSSTPALYSEKAGKARPSRSKTTNNKMNVMRVEKKMNKRKRGNKEQEMEIAESIRWLAEAVVKSEQARMEAMREIERMRAEAEAKRFGAQFFQWAAPVGSRMDRMFRKRPVYHHSVQVIYEKEL